MGHQIYKIPRLKDIQIQAILQSMAKDFGPFSIDISVFDHSIGAISFPSQPQEIWKELVKNNGELISRCSGAIAGVSIQYYRGGLGNQPSQRSPIFDDLVIDTNGVEIVKLKVANRLLQLARPVEIENSTLVDDQVVAMRAIQEATFARLQLQQEKLFEQTVRVRSELDANVSAKEKKLEADFNVKSEQLHAELQKKQENIEAEHLKLEERVKELDRSDNTFARRQIRERMLNDVAERVKDFGVSKTTASARKPVAMGMYVLIAFFAALLLMTIFELQQNRTNIEAMVEKSVTAMSSKALSDSSSTPADYSRQDGFYEAINFASLGAASSERLWLWIRLSLLSLGLVASLIYYIKWQGNWAQQFASTEQSLRQFYVDVNRANWVVETCLEWKKEAGSEVPAPLVESLARGLFLSKDQPPQILHPADELASVLLGSASKLSLAVGGGTIDIDKPGKIPKIIGSQSNE